VINFLKKIFGKPKISSRGINNLIDIAKSAYTRKLKIKIYGSNNEIKIADNAYIHNTYISIGFPDTPINNCKIIIGAKSSINSASIQLGESDSEVIIGDNCMFSFNVELACTDTHSILDMEDNLINKGKFIHIGSKVWICKNVCILKNSNIPDGCIVAQGAVVSKQFDEKNAVIAGNSARVVKSNIKWSEIRPENIEKS